MGPVSPPSGDGSPLCTSVLPCHPNNHLLLNLIVLAVGEALLVVGELWYHSVTCNQLAKGSSFYHSIFGKWFLHYRFLRKIIIQGFWNILSSNFWSQKYFLSALETIKAFMKMSKFVAVAAFNYNLSSLTFSVSFVFLESCLLSLREWRGSSKQREFEAYFNEAVSTTDGATEQTRTKHFTWEMSTAI